MDIEFEVVKSKRKTVSIQVTQDIRVIVKAPLQIRDFEIEELIRKKEAWISKHLELMRQRHEFPVDNMITPKMTDQEIQMLAKKASKVIQGRVKYYAEIIGVTYGRITIRNQKTRWGSYSNKGNKNFNCRLMKAPTEVLDYVIIHELCHRIEMNHSKRFWNLVEQTMPEYRLYRKWLKENGARLN